MDPSYAGQPIQVPNKVPIRRNGPSGQFFMIIAGLVVAVLIGIGLMVVNQDNSGPLSQRLAYRLEALVEILDDGKENASSDKLRKVTSEASILLLGDITAVETGLPEAKGKKAAEIATDEDSEPSLERLKTAKINGTYDNTYTTELTTKLESTAALTRELYDETRDKELRAALNTMYQHIVQLQKDLAAN